MKGKRRGKGGRGTLRQPLHDKTTADKTDHFDATGCDETITFHASLHL